MADFYQTRVSDDGHFLGRVLIQAKGSIGGKRHVFYHMNDGDDGGIRLLSTGCNILNPFKGRAKAYTYDLVEFKLDGTGYLLKTYLVASDVAASDTTIKIVRDGYKHIPFVGDTLMIAPSTLTGTGVGATVTAVKATTDATYGDIWELTLSAAIGEASANAVLVEAAEAGDSVKALVTNPNAFLPCDYDFLYDPNIGDDEFEKARYLLTPSYGENGPLAWISKMSPIPPAVLALNKSLIEGLFHL